MRWEGYVSTDVEWTHGIEQYISASCMEHDRTWGSEVEMMALAHLLDPSNGTDTTQGMCMACLTCVKLIHVRWPCM